VHQSIRDYWFTFTEPLEGRVDFMYLDRRGWVSTGIGNKIDETAEEMSAPTADERTRSLTLANEVTWSVGHDGPDASAEDVAAAWDTVKALLELAEVGHLAFADKTNLRLSTDEINRLVISKLEQMENHLVTRPQFTSFDAWPANAQLATLSMCWALGPAFNFPSFQSHVEVQNWPGAAEECTFGPHEGTIIVRNALDQDHFLLAQRVVDEGLPLEQIALDISTAFGVQGGLIALGYKPGRQDGDDGPSTQDAVRRFEQDNGLAETGAFDDPTTRSVLAQRLGVAGFVALGA
jgi:hypothetical protein